ncbi:MAG: response regulator transcription factor [Dehalococcoidia bacterium]
MLQRIILIGRDEPVLSSLAQLLGEEGYEVSVCLPEATALDALFADPPDVIVLDLDSTGEDQDVKELIQGTHKGEGAAVVGLVGQEQLSHLDLTLGLDDFVLGGAGTAEVSARIRQALWKKARVDAKDVLKCGDLVMDLANYTVYIAGRPVDLTYKEYELLRFLATNPDRVFSREVLLNKVWGYDFYGGARTVDVHVRRLRSKIEDRHRIFIETVRNVGYRFRSSP